jgi:hypothetical protein
MASARFATFCMVSVLKMHVLYNSYEKRNCYELDEVGEYRVY